MSRARNVTSITHTGEGDVLIPGDYILRVQRQVISGVVLLLSYMFKGHLCIKVHN